MIFFRNYFLFRNKNKIKVIDFNLKCIFFYKRGLYIYCVYFIEFVYFVILRVNLSLFGYCKNLWLICVI